jgi:hypothetical protein
MAGQFFQCLTCGKDGEALAEPEDRPTKQVTGWVVFLGIYWPAGVAPGPLVLRICGACYLVALVKSI